jgi:UDP-N-acetylglucosamine--N-acetylmuramyl-(pentapeptide) pyrophosphoryl-undecaprenol N-acetylglucosamine transferase
MAALKIIIAGGGTGGHIFPALAIGHALKKNNQAHELLYVGAKHKMEMEKVPQAGFRIIGLDIVGFNRAHLLKNISLPYKLFKSFWEARKIIKTFQPNLVVGVGGYASFPILFMAQLMHIPTLIQEQNSFAGKSNQFLAKKAKMICTAYPNMEQFFPNRTVVLTGNPVRSEISTNAIAKYQGIEFFGLQHQYKTVLIVGGSLGASSINKTIANNLSALLQQPIQIIWQTGTSFCAQAKEVANSYSERVVVRDFIKEMNYAYAAADIIISRAGALAISELSIVAKPVIFVPYPFAAEDHQKANALSLVNRHAASMVLDKDIDKELLPKLISLLQDEAICNQYAHQLNKIAITNADELIANHIIAIAS